MADTENLDSEFQNFLHQIESFIANYSYREKFVLNTWLTILKKSNGTDEERHLRNRFIKHFVEEAEDVFRTEPFKNIPKNFEGSLVALKKLLPKLPDEEPTDNERRSYIAELFRSLPDKGAFLSEQPVPRNGSFYIAIMKPDESATVCSKP